MRPPSRTREGPEAGPNLLDIRPRREAEWETSDDGSIVLLRRRPRGRSPRALIHWVWYLMAPPRIRLDEVGAFAWLGIDGRTTVGELSRRLRAEFGDSVEPVERRLGQFVWQLRRERFVSYLELDGRR